MTGKWALRLAVTAALIGLGVGERSARASGLNLEGGLASIANFQSVRVGDGSFGELGFSGEAGYEGDGWSAGFRAFGALSNRTALHIEAGGYDLKGSLHRREYGLQVLARKFLGDSIGNRRWYLEFGLQAMQTDFIGAENVYIVPGSPDYSRLFLRGGGFSLGVGYRPVAGPWFYQLNYRLNHYEALQIVGMVNYLHPVLAEVPLNSNYFIHSIVLLVGLNVFGRQ